MGQKRVDEELATNKEVIKNMRIADMRQPNMSTGVKAGMKELAG